MGSDYQRRLRKVSDSIRQRTKQNGVGSHIDAVSLEILALTSITERGYWGIELGGHTQQNLLDKLARAR